MFRNNMTVKETPELRKIKAATTTKGDFTCITFKPDLERFKMDGLDADLVSLLTRRAYGKQSNMIRMVLTTLYVRSRIIVRKIVETGAIL